MSETSAEMHKKLLEAKDELITIMRQVIEPINILTCRIIEEADMLVKDAMDERTFTGKKRKVVYRPSGQGGEEKSMIPTSEGTKLEKGKRACSICRKPGHKSTTCPERKHGQESS